MKPTVLLALLLMIFLNARAQEGFRFSVAGVPQISFLLNSGDLKSPPETYRYRLSPGWAVMALAGYNLADPYGFRIGVIYSRQGQIHTARDQQGNLRTIRQDLEYFKFPLTAHVNTSPGRFVLSLDLGPQVAVRNRVRILRDGTPVATSFDPKKAFSPVDLELAWAVGVGVRLTKWCYFSLGHRGDYGFLDAERKSYLIGGNPVNPYYPEGRKRTANLCLGLQAGFDFCLDPLRSTGRDGDLWFR